MDIYFTSDSHYGHKNIVRGETELEDKSLCRNFDTLEEHNQVLVDNINKVVRAGDVLYHAGDWALGGRENIAIFRRRLNCKTIHLALGNHDHHIESNKVIPLEFGFLNAKSLFTTVDKIYDKKIHKQNIVISHYAFKDWHKRFKGAWMLYGHAHGRIDNSYKSMDIGIDSHPEFRPYSFEELHYLMI